MIQLNLLPDVKIEFIKTRRLRRLVTLIAIFVSSLTAFIFFILIMVTSVWQGSTISSLQEELDGGLSKLRATEDLDKIVTIQSQLNSVNQLHESKSAPSRIYPFLEQIIPANVTIGEFNIDFETNALSMRGTTDTLERVNKLVDTLKFTKYRSSISGDESLAFNSVVLQQNSLTQEGAFYSINLLFEPDLFLTAAEDVALTVPNIVTTRSELESPAPLFKGLPDELAEPTAAEGIQ